MPEEKISGFKLTKAKEGNIREINIIKNSVLYKHVANKESIFKFMNESIINKQKQLETDIKIKENEEIPLDKLGAFDRFNYEKTLYEVDKLDIVRAAEKTIDLLQDIVGIYKEIDFTEREIIQEIILGVEAGYVRKEELEKAKDRINDLVVMKSKESGIYKRLLEQAEEGGLKEKKVRNRVTAGIGMLVKVGLITKEEGESMRGILQKEDRENPIKEGVALIEQGRNTPDRLSKNDNEDGEDFEEGEESDA